MPGGPRGGSCEGAREEKRGAGEKAISKVQARPEALIGLWQRVEGSGKWEGLPVHVEGAHGRC
jgi:hypothetical protein